MEYKVTAKEENINCHGLSFLCVLGEHINGGYVAILNWGELLNCPHITTNWTTTVRGY